MAKEVGQKVAEKQFEIMEEQQKKAQEFIDQKVMSQLVNSFWFFTVPCFVLPLLFPSTLFMHLRRALIITCKAV